MPTQVQLVITNRCNSRCQFCAYRMPGYTSNELFHAEDELGYGKIVEILDDCQAMGVGAIQITGGGEPTIHPQFSSIVQDVIVRGLDLAVVTNGNAVPRGSIPNLANAKWVRFSIDAASEATYMGLRGVRAGMLRQTWQTIRTLAGQRDTHATGVAIGVGFVVTKENHSEIFQAAKRAKEEGVDNFRISAVFQSDGAAYFNGFLDHAIELCRKAKELEAPEFRVFDNFEHRVGDLRQQSPVSKACGIQQFETYIGADKCVYRCCVLAYNSRGIIGSLKHRRFVDLWRSAEKHGDFEQFDARDCLRCMFNDKNRVIAYAADKNPPHVNFV